MASKLTKWINAQLKSKGKSSKEAQKDAGKYSSIAAAKRAGSLYYTDKKGRVMIAAYAEDLKAPIKTTPPKKRPDPIKTTPPKKRPEKKVPVIKAEKGPLKVKPTKEELLKDMEKNVEVQRKKREELEGVGRKKAGEALKEVDIKKMLSKLNPIGSADAATIEVLTVSKKPKNVSRSEAEKEIDNITKKIAKLRIKSADRKSTDRATLNKIRNEIKDQTALDKALRMDNKTEKERDARRAENKRDNRSSIEREADLLEQERKKKYKRGKATKRAKGGLIDMRSKGLFR
jgi:hypothetical protein